MKDCEDLLKTRVNEKFVWDSISTVELRLKRDILGLTDKKLDKFESNINHFMSIVNKETDKNSSLKNAFQDLKLEFDNKNWLKDIGELSNKLDIYKESIPNPVDYSKQFTEIHSQIEKINSELWYSHNKINDQTKQEFSLKSQIEKLAQELKNLTLDLAQKVDRDVLNDFLANQTKPKNPQMPPQYDSSEFWKFREKTNSNFRVIDEKFEKIAKILEMNQHKKTIKDKENKEEIMNLLQNHESRITLLENTTKDYDKNLDGLESNIRKFIFSFTDNSDSSTNALISKRRVFRSTNCLSCGKGELNHPIMTHIQGFDGRIYKAEEPRNKGGLMSTPEYEASPDSNTHDFERKRSEDISPNRSGIRLRSTIHNPSVSGSKELLKLSSAAALSPDLPKYRPMSARRP